MISWKGVCDELNFRGLKAVKQNLNLDSDEKADVIKGIVVETNDVSKYHVFCVDPLLEGAQSISKVADLLQNATNKSLLPDIDYSKYFTKDYILKNVNVALKSRLWSPYITRDSIFTEIQEYCYISDIYRKEDIRWMVEIRDDILSSVGISEDELWSAAKKNTLSWHNYTLMPLSSILGKNAEGMLQNSPLKDVYSVSSPSGIQGGIQILNNRLKDLSIGYLVTHLIVYPQSANNFLVGPDIAGIKESLLNVAINDSNQKQLTNCIYIISYNGDDLVVDDFIPYIPQV